MGKIVVRWRGLPRYRERVTARWSFGEQSRTGDLLLPGATAAAIRESLLPEDRAKFDSAYQHALATARVDLAWIQPHRVNELFRCLEHWRRLALLQRDPERFASIARGAAERLTGEPVPDGELLAETRRRAGMQPAVYRVTSDQQLQPQIDVLPPEALPLAPGDP